MGKVARLDYLVWARNRNELGTKKGSRLTWQRWHCIPAGNISSTSSHLAHPWSRAGGPLKSTVSSSARLRFPAGSLAQQQSTAVGPTQTGSQGRDPAQLQNTEPVTLPVQTATLPYYRVQPETSPRQRGKLVIPQNWGAHSEALRDQRAQTVTPVTVIEHDAQLPLPPSWKIRCV